MFSIIKKLTMICVITASIFTINAFSNFSSNSRYDSYLEDFLTSYTKFVTPEDPTIHIKLFTDAYSLLSDNYLKPIDNQFKIDFFGRGNKTLQTIKDSLQNNKNSINIEDQEIIADTVDEESPFVASEAIIKRPTAEETMEILMAVMFNQIDAHTVWLSTKSAARFKEQLSGNYKGIGVSFLSVQDDNYLEIKKIFDKSGADLAGLKVADKIYSINGIRIDLGKKYEHVAKIINSIKGENGTEVKLSIKRQLANKTEQDLDIMVKRGAYYIPSVEYEIINNKYAYINISSFNDDTYSLYRNAISKFNLPTLEGIILDLRGNPGGLLSQAVSLGNSILSGEEIVSIKGRTPEKTMSYYSIPYTLIPASIPIVVLIDNRSASASELIAASFALNNRAILLGDYTFGKWTVQASYTLSNKSIFNVTTQIFYSPFNATFQNQGIAPDINILPTHYFKNNQLVTKEEFDELRKKELRESIYPNALKVDNANSINRKPKVIINETQCPAYDKQDYILGCALVYLQYNNIQNFYNYITKTTAK